MLFALAFLATQSPAPPPASAEKCRIVVLNLVGRALPKDDEELPAILTETMASEIEGVSGCDVVSQQDILAMLDYEKQKAVCTDGSDSCLAEVGQALGADRVVAGTVGKLGAEFLLTARLMNVKKGAVEMRAEEPVGNRAENLRRAAKNVGRRRFGAGDLPRVAKGADTPIPKKTEPKRDGTSPLLWVGAVGAGVGALALVGGGALAAIADIRLGDPKETKKDAITREGQIALGVAAAGCVIVIASGVLVGVAVLE